MDKQTYKFHKCMQISGLPFLALHGLIHCQLSHFDLNRSFTKPNISFCPHSTPPVCSNNFIMFKLINLKKNSLVFLEHYSFFMQWLSYILERSKLRNPKPKPHFFNYSPFQFILQLLFLVKKEALQLLLVFWNTKCNYF